MGKVDCRKCKHLAITWEPKFPYACQVLGFKSSKMPSVTAFNATGEACLAFEPKHSQGLDNAATHVVINIGNQHRQHQKSTKARRDKDDRK